MMNTLSDDAMRVLDAQYKEQARRGREAREQEQRDAADTAVYERPSRWLDAAGRRSRTC